MKKYSKIVALGLSCAMAFSLAACGGDDKPQGTPDLDNVKSEQVTEAQWKSAFDFSQVTNVTLKNIERMTVAGVTTDEFSITKFDGDKVYEEAQWYDSEEVGGAPVKVVEKAYYSIGETESFEYSYDDETKTWSKEATTWYPQISSYTRSLEAIADAYTSFSYDASKNGYVATEIPNFPSDDFDTFTVKIVGGKLSVAQMDMTVEDGGITMTVSMIFQIYDLGKTSVTLPAVSGGDETPSGKVTEAQWEAAFAMDAFKNVTVTNRSSEMESYVPVFKIDLINDVMYQTMYRGGDDESSISMVEYIIAYVDGECRQFRCEDGKDWEYVGLAFDTPQKFAESMLSNLSVLRYEDFTYISEADMYVAENMSGMVGDGEATVNIKFKAARVDYVEIITTVNGQTESYRMTFSNYGTTVIQIPDVEITDVEKPEQK